MCGNPHMDIGSSFFNDLIPITKKPAELVDPTWRGSTGGCGETTAKMQIESSSNVYSYNIYIYIYIYIWM